MSTERNERLKAEAPLVELTEALRSERLPLERYVDDTCRRVERLEPRIRALLPERGRGQRLHGELKTLRERFPDPDRRPPLFGLLVGIKDIIRTDGFATRAGSMLSEELFAGPEAACVRSLREAGALVLGKTVTTEFAHLDPGPTANPNDPSRTPGGSSSGSAAAVAAGYAPLALGTQTVGSVIRPAAFCGVVGFKPSYDRVPTDGVLPFSRSVDCVGLFAQNVACAERAAAVLCPSWRSGDAAPDLPSLGVPVGPYLEHAEPVARRVFEEQLERLERAGCRLCLVPALRDIEEVATRHLRLITKEFEQVHAAWFAEHGALYRPSSAMALDRARELPADVIEEGRMSSLRLRRELESLMRDREIDLWASPAAPGPAPSGLDSTGDAAMNLPWTHARLPALTLPGARAADGLPLGLQLAARMGQDERLLAWARKLEPLLR